MEKETNPYEAPRARVGSAADEPDDLQQVISGQKLVIYSILVNLAAIALQGAVGITGMLAGLAALALSIYGVVRLAGGLGMSLVVRIGLSLLMFVPLVNLVALLIINARATRVLRAAGYKVGLLGASK